MTAEEMFKKLGYEKDERKPGSIVYKSYYKYRIQSEIEFLLGLKEVGKYIFDTGMGDSFSLNELKAVHKQIEELGWINSGYFNRNRANFNFKSLMNKVFKK